MSEIEEDNMQLVEREGTYELVDTKSLSAARLIEEEASGRESIRLADGPEPEVNPQAEYIIPEPVVPVTENTLISSETPAVSETPVVGAATLPITSSESVKKVIYTPYERSTPPPQTRSKSAGSKKSNARREQEDIEKKQMAEAAFLHWKKEKDNETIKRKKEAKVMKAEVDKAWHNRYKPSDRDSPAFKSWLQEKSRQRAADKEVEKLRAELITAELLTVDYEQTEGAYERWLKEKNRKLRSDREERDRRSNRDKAQLKQVISSLKSRWTADYNRSQYLHPNVIRAFDNTCTIACMDDF